MKTQVVVINPWVTDFKLYDEWMHPAGLYLLIAELRRSGISDVFFFNCLTREPQSKPARYSSGPFEHVEVSKPDLYKAIKRKYKRYGCTPDTLRAFLSALPYPPTLICVGSMMTYWVEGLYETIRVIRSVFPETPIALGGIAAQLIPDVLQKKLDANSLIAETLTCKEMASFLPDTFNASQGGTAAHTLSMVGAFELLDSALHGPVLSTLGCPFSCSYCASRQLFPDFHVRSVETICHEIRYLHERFGILDFAFYDDALLYRSPESLTELTSALAGIGAGLRFHTPNGLHLSRITAPILESFKQAGFVSLRFGYESGAAVYKRATSAKASRDELAKATRLVADAGFKCADTAVYVMAGLEGQQPAEVIEEISFVTSLGIMAKPVFISPVPGTALFNRYALDFPQIKTDPLWHNDTFFITRLQGWSDQSVEDVRQYARELNDALRNIA